MKQLAVVSGKGGTGKTTLAASFASMAEHAVFADCDVDAPDLHLLMRPEVRERALFRGGRKPFLDLEKCTPCGRCFDACRFDAIFRDGAEGGYGIDRFACEGCGFCFRVCPDDAIRMEECVCGEWFISRTRWGPMAHAQLGAGEENSGKLVTLVRNQARLLAEEEGRNLILIDGPPGIGCPVISAITGVDRVLIVSEPTLSGRHDLKRIAELTGTLGVKAAVCVNKHDLNPDVDAEIEAWCRRRELAFAGRIPFDRGVMDALARGEAVPESGGGPASEAIGAVWREAIAGWE